MATKNDSEGFVSTPVEGQGVRRKDVLILWQVKQTKLSFKQLTVSTESSKQTLQELHAVDDSAVI